MKRRLAMVTTLAALLTLGCVVLPASALDEADRLYLVGEQALADQFYPGWTLEVETDGRAARTMPILRTNRVMRGVW